MPGGTFISVGITTSGALSVSPASRTNAVVFRGIVAASATTPTVYIGENNQAAGIVLFTEAAPGFFTDGTGSNNVFEICSVGVNYDFTLAPYAKVVGGVAAGNLILRDGAGPSATNIVQGTADGTDCYYWTVWTKSTTASTIQIGNATFTSGPLINVNVNQPAGPVSVDLISDPRRWTSQLAATVTFAIAVFRNQVAVSALSQPVIPAGGVSKAGAIKIAETSTGQLKDGEWLCFEIMPRGSAGFIQAKYDTLISALNTAQLPNVAASGGLVVSPVSVYDNSCANQFDGGPSLSVGTSNQAIAFAFQVLQQSTAGTGALTVDNINLITLADAANGPVLFNVYGYGEAPTVVEFQAQVSNAKIGVISKLNIGAYSALGLRPTTGYTTKTPKVTTVGKYVTWKFTGGTALAGQRVNVMVAKKVNGVWGGPVYLKSAWADANGIVTFAWHLGTAGAINVRVQWPGNGTSYGVSTSPARGAYWK